MYGVGILAVVAAVMFMLKKNKVAPAPVATGGKFTVYGTDWCGYTTKQRDHLDQKYGKGSHEYVDCDKGGCPPGVNAFPVTKTPQGKMVKGFNSEL